MIARLAVAVLAALMATATAADPATPEEIAKTTLAPLLDPEKVKTLKGDRWLVSGVQTLDRVNK